MDRYNQGIELAAVVVDSRFVHTQDAVDVIAFLERSVLRPQHHCNAEVLDTV